MFCPTSRPRTWPLPYNRHFQQAVRRAAPARAAALGFELAEREKLTLELLSRMEREKREAPGLLQHADLSSLTRLGSFHFSVLRPLLDDEKLLTLLKEVVNNKPTKRAWAAWLVVVHANPAPSWAARNKSIIEAGLQATGTFASVAAVITKMPASIAEEHVDSLGAALSVLLAGLAGSYYLLVCAGASSGAACKDAPSDPRANPRWARRLPPRLRGEGRRPFCHRRETGARACQQGRLCGPAVGRPRGGLSRARRSGVSTPTGRPGWLSPVIWCIVCVARAREFFFRRRLLEDGFY